MVVALMATIVAGSATVVGGLAALHPSIRRPARLAAALAFAAGIMLFLSFAQIIPYAYADLQAAGVSGAGLWVGVLFLGGVLVVRAVDALLPELMNPTEVAGSEGQCPEAEVRANQQLLRSGLLVAVTVTAHNLPEGLGTFLAMIEDPVMGLALMTAIAIHNVPEGIAVAAPVYAATGSRGRALAWACGSGLAEPVGALIGYFALRAVLPEELMVLALALVAGMMVAVSVRELIPGACRYSTQWAQPVVGFACGVGVIWLSVTMG